mgnify:CR=1 FL=1
MNSKPISDEFPFESKYLEIYESNIHYIEEGEGDPILFLHGNPACNYLWRNIIPYLSAQGRCIAPDLIGMGKSDKPDLKYGFEDAYRYLDAFIKKMNLRDVTLVVHDWGSALGFHYANLNRDNIKAIAFMEAMYDAPTLDNVPLSTKLAIKLLRNPIFGKFLALDLNIFIKKMFPSMVMRKLTEKERNFYAAPYKTRRSRVPLLAFPLDGPIDDKKPTVVTAAVKSWAPWLASVTIPKLCLYVTPGVAIQEKDVKKIKETFVNTEMIHVGKGLHFIQEDHPHELGEALSNWHKKIAHFA